MRIEGPREKKGGPTVGYLVHIDAARKVLDQSTFYPNGDTQFGLSNVNRCLPWGDGFALVGTTTSGTQSEGWLIKYSDQSFAIFGQGDGGGGSGIAAITYMSPKSKLQAEYKFRGGRDLSG